MTQLTFTGFDIGLVEPGDNIVDRLLSETAENQPLEDGDIVVITSKVVSLAEERTVEADAVEVSDRDRRVAALTGIDPTEVAVIYDESEVLGAIPVAEVGEELLLEHAADPETARAALEQTASLLVTERNGRLCTNAGVDWSNSPEGMMTLLPADADRSARAIREEIEAATGTEVAVVIADSELMGAETLDLAVGCSGIDAVDSDFGGRDLFDHPKLGGVDRIADEVTAGSALLFGQTDQRTPVVVVRGLEYDEGEGTPNTGGLLRRGIRKTIALTTKLKARERF